MKNARMPKATSSIQKGKTLNDLLDLEAIDCLAHNISCVHPNFDKKSFARSVRKDLQPLSLMERGHHFASKLREHLPERYDQAVEILINSLTPPLTSTSQNGMGVFFYLPHICFVGTYGIDAANNGGADPFATSMKAQYELTRRFSAEFSIRHFLIHSPDRTLRQLIKWTTDRDPHVRRLCSEGTRPRLPWAKRIPDFIKDPRPSLPILEALKDDPERYVVRSVANHLGDIAKDHLDLALEICERWLTKASTERKWLIRHALRYPAKKEVLRAIKLRARAK